MEYHYRGIRRREQELQDPAGDLAHHLVSNNPHLADLSRGERIEREGDVADLLRSKPPKDPKKLKVVFAKLKEKLPEMGKSLYQSGKQVALTYGASAAMVLWLRKHDIDPLTLNILSPTAATLTYITATTAMFLAEYAAVRKQRKAGVTPASPQVFVPLMEVVGGKKGAKIGTGISVGIDLAKPAVGAIAKLPLVGINLIGLPVRFVVAALNYRYPGWSHSLIKRKPKTE